MKTPFLPTAYQVHQGQLTLAGLAGACLLSSCLTATHLANAQSCANLPTRRAQDSCAVKSMRAVADAVIQANLQPLTKEQLKQMTQTASALNDWSTKYFKPHIAEDAVAVRYFKQLVSAGRYFEWGNERIKAFRAYKRANLILLPSSPLRTQASAYAKELDTRLQLLDNYYRSQPPSPDPAEALRIRASFASVPVEDSNNKKVLEQKAKKQILAARLIENRLISDKAARALLLNPYVAPILRLIDPPPKGQSPDSARLATAPLRSTMPGLGTTALSDSARSTKVPLPQTLPSDE